MQSQSDRFTNRFKPLFEQEGLLNIKFFVTNGHGTSLSDFLEEAAAIQSTIVAGDFTVVDSVDAAFPQKAFDEAF